MSTASVKPQAVAIYGILVIAALVVAVPLVWIAEAAFRTQISLLTGQVLFQPTLAAFQQVLFSSTSDFLMNYRSSFIVGLLSTALCVRKTERSGPPSCARLEIERAMRMSLLKPLRSRSLSRSITAEAMPKKALSLPVWMG